MPYFIDGLADALRKYGLKVVEVDGWKTRGYKGRGIEKIVGTMHHHTATNRAAFARSHAPTLNIVTHGHSALPGPLCQILLARDGTCYIVAAGWANHAGTGKWTDIPWHRGNDHTVGIEYESSGIRPWDWTSEQLEEAPKLGAALRLIFAHKNDMSHAEYSDQGKIDTAGWPGGWDGLRRQIETWVARFTTPAPAPKPPVLTPAPPVVPEPIQEEDILASLDELRALLAENNTLAAQAIFQQPVTKIDLDGERRPYQWSTFIRVDNERLERQELRTVALTAALEKAAEGAGVDPKLILAQIDTSIQRAVDRHLSALQATVKLTNQGEPA